MRGRKQHLRQGRSAGQAKVLGAQSARSEATGLRHRGNWQLGYCFPGCSGGPHIALACCQGCLKAPGRGQPDQHVQAVTSNVHQTTLLSAVIAGHTDALK